MTPDDLLYEVERAVMIMRYPIRFSDAESAAQYYEHMSSSRWFNDQWPAVVKRKVEIRSSTRAHAWANFDQNAIYLPPWSLTDLILCHEVAHFCAARERACDHGPIFRKAHHGLIRHYMSKEAAKCYRHSCLAMGLDF
jgi:putative metallohydrolase (TIGR04338 family)